MVNLVSEKKKLEQTKSGLVALIKETIKFLIVWARGSGIERISRAKGFPPTQSRVWGCLFHGVVNP